MKKLAVFVSFFLVISWQFLPQFFHENVGRFLGRYLAVFVSISFFYEIFGTFFMKILAILSVVFCVIFCVCILPSGSDRCIGLDRVQPQEHRCRGYVPATFCLCYIFLVSIFRQLLLCARFCWHPFFVDLGAVFFHVENFYVVLCFTWGPIFRRKLLMCQV